MQQGGGGGGGGGGVEGLGLLMGVCAGALMGGAGLQQQQQHGGDAGSLLEARQRAGGGSGGIGAALKQEPLDDFSPGNDDELFHQHYLHHHHHHLHQHQLSSRGHHQQTPRHNHPHHHHHHHSHAAPSRPAMPPPYHLHQYVGASPGALLHLQGQTAVSSALGPTPKPQGLVGQHGVTAASAATPASGGGEREDAGSGSAFGDKQLCRWIDCSAAYKQQEELVRHIEKVHIDQRKGEDFTCFWAGCIRRYKPFNARYKLLIHMRVHSGEKPNKCMVSSLLMPQTHCQCGEKKHHPHTKTTQSLL